MRCLIKHFTFSLEPKHLTGSRIAVFIEPRSGNIKTTKEKKTTLKYQAFLLAGLKGC